MNRWVLGSRPRTLPAAVVPVVVGTAVAQAGGRVVWDRAGLALLVALALQIGTNYANDYGDGIRGTDEARVGPVRLVASGLATPAAVRTGSLCALATAAVFGAVLALLTNPWLLVVGAACLVAAWAYTAGPRPYGYAGLGEVFVFVFFGLVAVTGTVYVQLGRVTDLAVGAAVAVGALVTALLVVNNLRDIDGDARAGKRTLAVRIGPERTRALYAALVSGAIVIGGLLALRRPGAVLCLAAAGWAVRPVRAVLGGAAGPALIEVLGATARLELVFGALLAAGVIRWT